MTCHPSGRHERAFTLLELLIVMGIIAILISILLPAANGIRRQAKVLQTQTVLSTLRDAISMYQTDQRDWPGPFDHVVSRATGSADYAKLGGQDLTGVGPPPAPTGKLRPSRSEELFLCLTGGMSVKWSGGTTFTVSSFDYTESDIGRGHMQMGPKNRGRLKDYVSGSKSRSGIGGVDAKFNADSDLPEFVDSFGGPILYVRAKRGEVTTDAYYGALYDEMELYQAAKTYPAETTAPLDFFPRSYLESDTLPNQTREQNRFVLISAGADRKFGTADDVGSFGPPQIKLPTP